MRNRYAVALLTFVSGAGLGLGADPERYTGPWKLEDLRKPPKMTVARQSGGVASIYYEGESLHGKPTRVFAYLARPEKPMGKLPAMVLVHGGGGTAFREWAELWAKRGYVALAMDLAGQGPDRKRLADGSPNQDANSKFQREKITDFWSYHAVANVIRGVSLVRSLPEVDDERVGITGISWGGYLTCIVAGLDDRLKVAVPVYGCGFLHINSAWISTFQKMSPDDRKRWVQNFDPSKYLPFAKMPMLFVNGTNDFAYPLDSYRKSYQLVNNRRLCVTVRMPHGHQAGWAPVEIDLFADQHLKGGKPVAKVLAANREGETVTVKYESEVPIRSAALHFTTDEGPWQKRRWKSLPAKVEPGVVTAVLPQARPLVYFLSLTDSRNAVVSAEHRSLGRR